MQRLLSPTTAALHFRRGTGTPQIHREQLQAEWTTYLFYKDMLAVRTSYHIGNMQLHEVMWTIKRD